MELKRNNRGVLQKRTGRPGGFGKAARARFLDALALTCNVRASARHAGVDARTAERLRTRDGQFARLWADAIDLGQVRLKEELLARALGQVDDEDNPGAERAQAPARLFDPDLALKILQLAARTAPGGQRRAAAAPAPTQAEVDAALMKRVEVAVAMLAKRKPAVPPGAECRVGAAGKPVDTALPAYPRAEP